MSALGLKLNPNKTQSIIVSRSRTLYPAHPDLELCGSSIAVSSYFKLLGVLIDDKLTFEKHIRTLASSISQKTGLLRKCYRCFRDEDVIIRSFFAFILPCFEYCSAVWSSAAATHLRLLDRALSGIRFLIPDLNIDLAARRDTAGLCLLFKIFNSLNHPMKVKLPHRFVPGRATRLAGSMNSLAFQKVRFNTNQFSRCFILCICEKWNKLPDAVVNSSDAAGFKSAVCRCVGHDSE